MGKLYLFNNNGILEQTEGAVIGINENKEWNLKIYVSNLTSKEKNRFKNEVIH